jgi:hypothetical protein
MTSIFILKKEIPTPHPKAPEMKIGTKVGKEMGRKLPILQKSQGLLTFVA